jgi:U3 small nucleolar RNA-associated protein 3
LLTKSLLQTSTALNVAAYLLLKAEHAAKEKDVDDFVMDGDAGSEIKSHPVMTRLQQLNKLSMKLEDTVESKVPSLQDQLDNLVKAASLMQEEGSGDEEEEETEESEVDEENGEMMEQDTPLQEEALSEDEKIDEDEEQEIARGVLNDARFGLRPQEVKAATSKTSSSKRKPRRPVPSDFGDEEKEDARSRKAAQSLASTVNAMQQRSASKSRKPSRHDEILDAQDQEAAMARGLKMMEAEMGALDDDGIEAFGGGVATAEVDDELDDGLGGGDSFYDQVKKKSEARKAFKKQLHAVAPKFPRSEVEVDGERAINSVILKNRGLVAHKNKLNRNPRVKKREQYRKALIKRKGNVREIRTEEGHKYAGEETGIKTGLSRSRKLGTN